MIRTALKFGAFSLVCLAVTIYLAFTIGNIRIQDPLGRDYYTLSATFDDVTGLAVNDNVKIAGVVVGKVSAISVEQGRARVSFQVQNSYKVPSDSTTSIRWRNLIGQRYLYLNAGSAPDMLRNGDSFDRACTAAITTRCTASVVDLGALFNRLGPIVGALDSKKINDFLDTVSQALNGNTDKVSQAIDDLSVLAKALGERDQTIARLVDNLNTVAGAITNRDQQIRVMLDNLVLISQTFSDNTQTLDTALQELSRFSTNLSSVLTGNRSELDRIISNLELVTREVVAPKLSTLGEALSILDTTSKAIFESSDLGEWLNQSILCAAVGPPQAAGTVLGSLAGSNCTGLGNVGSSGAGVLPPGAPAAPAAAAATGPTSAPSGPASIGTEAGSQQAGTTALFNLLSGAVK